MRKLFVLALFCSVLVSFAAEKYTGPVPPKTDVPYLLHANTLVETDVSEAREETQKGSTHAVVPGASAHARTPLAEPVFIMKADKIIPDRMGAFRMDVKNGNREVTINSKKGKGLGRPIFLNVTRLGDNLYKIEVDQILENGQYTLSPEGSNQTFSFEVY